MFLEDWIGTKPNLALAEEELGEVRRLSYISSFISPGGCISEEVSRIHEARLVFANLRYLRRPHNIRSPIKD